MSSPILAIAAAADAAVSSVAAGPSAGASPGGFGDMLSQGLKGVDQKVANAEQLVHAFALDDSVPLHQVTIALEEAQLALEFALQVRGKLVDAYRDVMNMQL